MSITIEIQTAIQKLWDHLYAISDRGVVANLVNYNNFGGLAKNLGVDKAALAYVFEYTKSSMKFTNSAKPVASIQLKKFKTKMDELLLPPKAQLKKMLQPNAITPRKNTSSNTTTHPVNNVESLQRAVKSTAKNTSKKRIEHKKNASKKRSNKPL